MGSSAAARTLVLRSTEAVRLRTLGDLSLRLITPASPLWRATEAEVPFPEPAFWAFLWPGGYALARYVLERPSGTMHGQNVFDFGAGCGICGIAALKAGANSVVANDIDALALASVDVNASGAGFSIGGALSLDERDLIGNVDELADIHTVLAGDMTYDEEATSKAMDWLIELAATPASDGSSRTVLVGDPGRSFIGAHAAVLEQVGRYALPAAVLEANSGFTHADVFRVTP